MKSKEEIFDEVVGRHHRELSPLNYKNVCDFSDQYSEQIAIGFIEWIANNRIYRHEIAKGVWNWEVIKETTPGVFTAFPEYDHYSTAELFNLYKQTLTT